eukprot:6123594-Amphidinium_carterae.1
MSEAGSYYSSYSYSYSDSETDGSSVIVMHDTVGDTPGAASSVQGPALVPEGRSEKERNMIDGKFYLGMEVDALLKSDSPKKETIELIAEE